MNTGSGPPIVFALIIAPRKLQSLAAAVQAVAAAVSSDRSTFSIIGAGGIVSDFAAAERKPASSEVDETLALSDTPTIRPNASSNIAVFVFLALLLRFWFGYYFLI